MPKSLRILIVTPGLPHRSWGFGTRVYHLARYLGLRHTVTVLSYGMAEEEEREASTLSALRSNCELHVVRRPQQEAAGRRWHQALAMLSGRPFAVRELHTPAMQAAIDELTSRQTFDIIQVESSQMCSYRFPRAPLVLDEHNIEYELLRRMQKSERSVLRKFYNGWEHAKFRRLEQDLWLKVSACVVTSDREQAIVRQHAPETASGVVPNGVDLEYFAPEDQEPEAETLVFTGLLSYRPNLDAVRYLVDDIMPEIERAHHGVKLTVVGQGTDAELAALARPNVITTGWVPDVRPYLARAAVVVVPIRMGSGTRLKVIEALSMGKAMVSTSAGCEGVNVSDGVHLIIADKPAPFATAVARLLSDRALSKDMGRAGRALMAEHYSWERSAARLEEIHCKLAADDRPNWAESD